MRKAPVAFVLLAQGFGAANWNARFHAGKIIGINEEYAYGYHHAERHGLRVVYSEDQPEGWLGKLFRLTVRALLGFDFVHAWRNREAFFAADVVWTHTESLSLSAALLCRLYPRRPAPHLILQSVWLCDRWDRLSPPKRWLYRWLLAEADVLTFLSPLNLAKARKIFAGQRCELVLFGISTARTQTPREPGRTSPARLLSLGNDRHRDWATLVDAVRDQPDLQLTIVSGTISPALIAKLGNCRVVQPRQNAELEALFAEADLVIVPLVHNLHASGITVLEEAVIQGCPVIVSDAGGLRAYFTDDEVWYVPAGDGRALRQTIKTVLTSGAQALQRAQAAQRALMSRGLSSEAFALRHALLSFELLEAAASGTPLNCSQETAA